MNLFDAGVASGDVTATSVVLWTRVMPAGGDLSDVIVGWEIGQPGEPPTSAGTTTAAAADDHTVHVEVDGLEPGTTYGFSFECSGSRAVGRTRTLPASADRFRFVVACCSRWGWPGFELYDAIADEQPDLLVHLGDFIYEVGEFPPTGPATEPPWECRTLRDYRRRYRQHHTDPALRRLLGSVPMLAVWDDHEVVDNAPDPGEADRRRAGQQAWADWMPNRRTDRPGPLDRFLGIDGLLDLALVDSRFGGRPASDIDVTGDTGSAPGSILSDAQWRRLEESIDHSTAPWLVFANQVQVGPMTLAARPALGRPPWRRIVNPDQWDGYPADRERLYRLLRRGGGQRVVLSGDLHSAWSRTLSDDHGHVAHEFTSPSISGLTYADAVRDRLPVPAGTLGWWLRLLNRDIDHLDLTRHGYVVCDVTPETFVATFASADGGRHTVTLGREG